MLFRLEGEYAILRMMREEEKMERSAGPLGTRASKMECRCALLLLLVSLLRIL